jgi:hypothetical protein
MFGHEQVRAGDNPEETTPTDPQRDHLLAAHPVVLRIIPPPLVRPSISRFSSRISAHYFAGLTHRSGRFSPHTRPGSYGSTSHPNAGAASALGSDPFGSSNTLPSTILPRELVPPHYCRLIHELMITGGA